MSKKEYQKDKRARAMAALAELNAGKEQKNTTEIVDDDSLCMPEQLQNILIEKGHMKRRNNK